MKVFDRQQFRDVRSVGLILERGDLRELAMLLSKLGGRRDLDGLGIAERTLRERREPAQRLDLVAEQIDAHGAVLGCREHVEQAAANRELASVLDLVDPLVSGRHEVACGLVQIEQLARMQHEPARTQRRVGNLLRQRDRADDHDRRSVAAVKQRVERRDPQADKMRRGRKVRLVGDAAARVVPHRARLEPRPQRAGQIPRRTVISGDDDRRPVRLMIQERSHEVGAQRLRDERAAAVTLQRSGLRIVIGVA